MGSFSRADGGITFLQRTSNRVQEAGIAALDDAGGEVSMNPYTRHLRAAIGYLELGLPADAEEEIEAIPPEMKTLSEVLVVRVEIFRALGK